MRFSTKRIAAGRTPLQASCSLIAKADALACFWTSLRAEMPRRKWKFTRRVAKRVSMGAQNAMELVRLGRLTPRDDTPYEILHVGDIYRLRRYTLQDNPEVPRVGGPLLLIPPLMLTAEIYDVSPELSAVTRLRDNGIDAWTIDFGAPEDEEGGMHRTLDDHVKAVAEAVGVVRELTGKDVHLAGYSQGGMFAYQAAAFLRSKGLASLITFGSPVDIHANAPFNSTAAERLALATRKMVELSLERIEGIPGTLSSVGFRILTPGKEALQLFDFVRKLHDRNALAKRETRRRFLGGEGFVAWPGPALRQFVDEFVIHNRLVSGGLVIDGRSVTLADIDCPILIFVGSRDDFARPPSVRAIRRAAPEAEIFEVVLAAGHFGLVVGSTSLTQTWPTVSEWLKWRVGDGPRPSLVPMADRAIEIDEDGDELGGFDPIVDVDLFYDTVSHAAKAAWSQLGHWTEDLASAAESLRWQLPRLSKLRRLEPHTRTSVGKLLAEKAEQSPEETFFLWQGRAFSYRQADIRIDNIVRGLIKCGVRPGTRVGVLMGVRPTYLSLVTAVNRIGAVSVLMEPETETDAIRQAVELGEIGFLVADPNHAARAQEAFDAEVLVLGGAGTARKVPPGCVDMEAIDPDRVALPDWYRPNPGRASDLSMILFSAGRFERSRAARITNRRWAFAAYGAAAAATLTPHDTVYSCLPLHHPSGILVSVGAALVGGARIALAPSFSPDIFWDEVRRYGATVAFYAGGIFRELVDAPVSPSEHVNPLRLFAGSGMRKDVWRRLSDRFGVGVLEFYASTEGNLVLANASGEKVGALGHPLPGSAELALVRYDLAGQEFVRKDGGYLVACDTDDPGVLLAKIDATHPSSAFEGVREQRGMSRVRRDVFEPGDRWFVTGDLMRRDSSGDYWLIDRVADMIPTPSGYVSTRSIEDALYQTPGVRLTAVYGLPAVEGAMEVVAAALVMADGAVLDLVRLNQVVTGELSDVERPRVIRVVADIPLTTGYRPKKNPLRRAGLPSNTPTYVYDLDKGEYVDLKSDTGATVADSLALEA